MRYVAQLRRETLRPVARPAPVRYASRVQPLTIDEEVMVASDGSPLSGTASRAQDEQLQERADRRPGATLVRSSQPMEAAPVSSGGQDTLSAPKTELEDQLLPHGVDSLVEPAPSSGREDPSSQLHAALPREIARRVGTSTTSSGVPQVVTEPSLSPRQDRFKLGQTTANGEKPGTEARIRAARETDLRDHDKPVRPDGLVVENPENRRSTSHEGESSAAINVTIGAIDVIIEQEPGLRVEPARPAPMPSRASRETMQRDTRWERRYLDR